MVMFFSHLNCFHLSGQTLRDTSATHEAKVTPVNCFNSLLVRDTYQMADMNISMLLKCYKVFASNINY